VRSGTASGDFRPVAPPDEVADRLVALVDGLALKAVLGGSWMTPERMRATLLRFADQLEVAYEDLDRRAQAE
jgi:transcriptional regulator BetI-like protein